MIMKFTKQIAQALANKAKRELVSIRKERVKTFKVPEEITAQILQLSTAYFTAVGTMNSALKGIVAGVMMAGISTVLTFLGF